MKSDNGTISAVIEALGIVEAPAQTMPMTDTGRTLKVGGYPCRLYRSHVEADVVSEICVAENSSLNLSSEDFNTLRSLWTFSGRLLERAETLLSGLGLMFPPMKLEDTGGLPIAIYTAKEHRQVRMKHIERSAGPSTTFNVPKNYSRSQIPFISG